MTSLKSYSTEVKKKIKCISSYKEFQEWLDPESYVDRAYFLSVPFLSVFFSASLFVLVPLFQCCKCFSLRGQKEHFRQFHLISYSELIILKIKKHTFSPSTHI